MDEKVSLSHFPREETEARGDEEPAQGRSLGDSQPADLNPHLSPPCRTGSCESSVALWVVPDLGAWVLIRRVSPRWCRQLPRPQPVNTLTPAARPSIITPAHGSGCSWGGSGWSKHVCRRVFKTWGEQTACWAVPVAGEPADPPCLVTWLRQGGG